MAEDRINWFLYASALCVNLLSLCAGSAFSWASPVLPKLSSSNPEINPFGKPITTFEESWIASLVCLGCTIGSVISAPISVRIGRKKTLIMFSLTIFVAHVLFAIGTTVASFLLGRFLLGLGVGCIFSTLPSFVGEISEDSNRGLLGCTMSLVIVTGMFFNYAVGPFVSIKLLSIFNLVPLLIFYPTFVLLVPESPYYYLSTNNKYGAVESLRKFRTKPAHILEKEIEYMTESLQSLEGQTQTTISDIFKSKVLINGLVLICGLLIFQQLSGITAFTGYMESIFEASQSSLPSHISVIIIGLIQILANIITTFVVDKLGKRLLLIISCTGSFMSTLSLGAYFYLKDNNFDAVDISWLPIMSLVIFMITYSLGLGPLPWAFMGEVFPANFKSIASSICTCLCFSMAFIITMIFPYLKIIFGMSGTFWLFSICCAVSLMFTVFKVPETKSKSLQEILDILGGYKQ